MSEQHERLLSQAKRAIDKLVADTSVELSVLAQSIEELAEHVDEVQQGIDRRL